MGFENIEPKNLWKHFIDITRIPHPSGSEAALRKHLISWAKSHGFSYKEDKTGNLAISVPATRGLEKSPITVLQGHLDMVAEKNSNSKVDPTKDPLDVYKDGDFLKARGTTLGADNGIAIAAGMAIAEDDTSRHGPLELLFTVEEETGLIGANSLCGDFLKGRRLLNLDSEEFGVFFAGCAGGSDSLVTMPANFAKAPSGMEAYKIKVLGLKGGHSGLDIIANRANAIKLLAFTLKELSNVSDFRLAYIKGGSKRNAIPREAEAHVLLKKADVKKLEKVVKEREEFFKKEYKGIEDGIAIDFEKLSPGPKKVMGKNNALDLIKLLVANPSGVIAMSRDIKGLVETSTNMGVIETKANAVEYYNLLRSSVAESFKTINKQLFSIAELAGAKAKEVSSYPGWMPNMGSALLKIGKDVYAELYKEEPQVTAIHAGLECGIIGEKFDGMDMISFGPNLSGVHSPDEKVSISSTEKFYDYLKYFLEKLS